MRRQRRTLLWRAWDASIATFRAMPVASTASHFAYERMILSTGVAASTLADPE